MTISAIAASDNMNQFVVNSHNVNADSLAKQSNLLTGWFTCIKLLKALNGASFTLTHVCDGLESIAKVNHATTLDSAQLRLLREIGVSETQLILECDAHHCLGKRYINWTKAEQAFNCVEGDYGVDFHRVEFSHYLSWQLQHTNTFALEDFSLAAQMAKNNCFTHPSHDPKSILSSYSYSLNLDTYKLIVLLRKLALSRTELIKELAIELDSEVVIQRNGDQVTLVKVATKNEQYPVEITTDFYFDATGYIEAFHHKSTETTAKIHYFIAELPPSQPSEMVTKLQSHDFGLSKITYLKSKSLLECCYQLPNSAKHHAQSPEQDLRLVLKALAEAGLHVEQSTLRQHQLDTDYYGDKQKQVWQGNTLVLNDNSVSRALALIGLEQLTELNVKLDLWLSLFPAKQVNQGLLDYFNERHDQRCQNLHDYLACHFYLVQWRETVFWQHAVIDKVSESLSNLLNFFKQTGRLPEFEEPVVTHKQWKILLIGLDFIPDFQDPMIHNETNITEKLNSLRAYIAKSAERIPPYQAYLKHHGL